MATPELIRAEPQSIVEIRRVSPSVLIQVLIVVGLMWVLFQNVLVDMAKDWWNVDAYSQGMLLPPLALYVAWLGRFQTFRHPVLPDVRGIFITALACTTFVLGRVASEFFLTRISFVVFIVGLIATFWGFSRLKTLAFPLLLLATMVPLPTMVYNSLAAPLQLFASDLAAQIAQICGVSVYRDGNILELAGVTLGVAEACSGLNSLSALFVGSILLGYLTCSGLTSRMILFFAAIPLAIIVNIARVTGTAVIADYNQEFAMGFYHTFSGWLVFVAGFGLLYALATLLHMTLERK
jgi:exosortase